MRRANCLALPILAMAVLAACQVGPSQPAAPSPEADRTLPAEATPAATIPDTAIPTETSAAAESATPGPTETEGEETDQAVPPPGMIRYANQEFGYQIDIPAESDIYSDLPDLVRIDLPFSAGTNLSEKYLEISVAGGQAGCSSPYARGFDPAALQSKNRIFNGIEFLEESGGEGAAGSVYEFISYSTPKDEICLSLSFILHSANPGMFETPPPEFDPLLEKAIFETILQTFAWRGD